MKVPHVGVTIRVPQQSGTSMTVEARARHTRRVNDRGRSRYGAGGRANSARQRGNSPPCRHSM